MCKCKLYDAALLLIGGPVELPQEDVEFFSDFFQNKYGQR